MSRLRIIQISDTHLAPGQPEVEDNFARLAEWVRAEAPDLAIHTGDLCRDAPGAPEELAFAAERLDALGVPLLMLPGNHDVGDNPADGHQPASPVAEGPLAAWTQAFPSDRWIVDLGAWRAVGLNAQLFQSGLAQEAEQDAWLETALTGHDRIALFLHKPLFLEDPSDEADVPYRYVPSAPRRRLMELIRRGGVRTVACGHVHQTRQAQVEGVLHAWAPSTAFVLPDDVQPRIGEKLCGALDWSFGPDGVADCRVAQPEGMRTRDIRSLPTMYG